MPPPMNKLEFIIEKYHYAIHTLPQKRNAVQMFIMGVWDKHAPDVEAFEDLKEGAIERIYSLLLHRC